jgi:hypothetical protein
MWNITFVLFFASLNCCKCFVGLAEDMYDDGYQNIRSTDFSTKAIEIMKKRAADKPGLVCLIVYSLLSLTQFTKPPYASPVNLFPGY